MRCQQVAIAILVVGQFLIIGCQHNPLSRNAGVMPTPSISGANNYYTPQNVAVPLPPGTATGTVPTSLSPGGLTVPSPLSTTKASDAMSASGASATPTIPASRLENTYDVTARMASDNQPIRILEGGSGRASLASASQGMRVNDGTNATSWSSVSQPLPLGVDPSARAALNTKPFAGLRGSALQAPLGATPQGFSGLDGQWKTRSSYEATERR